MEWPVLDVFVLSLLDRGLRTPYDLRQAGISLGASTPSLRRLLAQKLVTKSVDSEKGRRPRHEYKLTSAGKHLAGKAWEHFLSSPRVPDDIDAVLRVIDMSVFYGADRAALANFIRRIANKRMRSAVVLTNTRTRGTDVAQWTYAELRFPIDDARLRAEAKALMSIVLKLKAKKVLPFQSQPRSGRKR